MIRLDSPDVVDIYRSHTAYVVLPAGEDWEGWLSDPARVLTEPSVMSEEGIEHVVVLQAACRWEASWLSAHRAGRTAEEDAASRWLAGLPSLPVVISTDGGGSVALWRAVAFAAARGDSGPVANDFELNC